MTNTYCCIYSVETPDDGQQICLKNVEFFNKINLRNCAVNITSMTNTYCCVYSVETPDDGQ